jgi:hypothetical protein
MIQILISKIILNKKLKKKLKKNLSKIIIFWILKEKWGLKKLI